mmetsp:Transcript_1805/g.4996  ORF Transcript_1805/g.4996 Transcript_1805/m.4996 type:complete len:114 (+) Transcript_1805:240-581(+)
MAGGSSRAARAAEAGVGVHPPRREEGGRLVWRDPRQEEGKLRLEHLRLVHVALRIAGGGGPECTAVDHPSRDTEGNGKEQRPASSQCLFMHNAGPVCDLEPALSHRCVHFIFV